MHFTDIDYVTYSQYYIHVYISHTHTYIHNDPTNTPLKYHALQKVFYFFYSPPQWQFSRNSLFHVLGGGEAAAAAAMTFVHVCGGSCRGDYAQVSRQASTFAIVCCASTLDSI